jgi:hypothetical protein
MLDTMIIPSSSVLIIVEARSGKKRCMSIRMIRLESKLRHLRREEILSQWVTVRSNYRIHMTLRCWSEHDSEYPVVAIDPCSSPRTNGSSTNC